MTAVRDRFQRVVWKIHCAPLIEQKRDEAAGLSHRFACEQIILILSQKFVQIRVMAGFDHNRMI